MTLPLIILAVLSVVAGMFLGLPLGDSTIHHWLAPVFHPAQEAMGVHAEPYQLFGIDGALILVSVAVATIGMVAAWRMFGFFGIGARLDTVRALTARVPDLYRGSFHKWYFDELNDLLFVRIGGRVADAFAWFDVHVIDGAVNGVATLTRRAGDEIRHSQTGRVQNYALGIAGGLILIAVSLLLVGTR
jgi:NADH-quinone oxidoreductase subunit L